MAQFESFYAISKSSWGIRIGFTGEFINNPTDLLLTDSIKINHNVYLKLQLNNIESPYMIENRWRLENGVKWVESLIPEDIRILITLNSIDFNLCDFQPEGFFFGIADWICKFYNINMPVYYYSYDNKVRRYFFWFDDKDIFSTKLLHPDEEINNHNSFYIKLQPHFRLNIPFKDKILFEAEMYKRNIPFHADDNPMALTRYFLLDADSERIDAVIKDIGIIAGNDTISTTDYGDAKKANRIYLYVAIVVIILFLIVNAVL